ncbi:hypothetical protein ATK36_1309 [Amycolatopsis sulphurea]|uniref:Uncharacterized protein n=1 Tax=Amycolatopsis sulphurea TaxID=76022 RepID=A0A2A9F6A8_9PSEU|nr:hypothetical protein [Amycolatopsis sulphurea]PFG46336.1 hypothetical protein ATK36_1309 [Amycolatopsis sulphurea]
MGSLSRIGLRALALACTAGILSAGSAAVAVAAPSTTAEIIIIDGYTQTVKESSGTPVLCPTNQVLLGRSHSGDENGNTTYYCGLILIDGQQVRVGAPTWSASQRESNSFFAAPGDQVLVGRQHSGDENGSTRYATATMSAWGRTVELTSYRWSPDQKESSSYSKAGDYEVMVGRQHSGDENGQTRYQYARIVD